MKIIYLFCIFEMIIMRGMSYALPSACAIQNKHHDMRITSKQPQPITA